MEGFDSGNEQILLTGAANRPQELDEAARRRLTKRLYIPLPTTGYSGSVMKILVKDASMSPLREALREGVEITNLKKDEFGLVILSGYSALSNTWLIQILTRSGLRESITRNEAFSLIE